MGRRSSWFPNRFNCMLTPHARPFSGFAPQCRTALRCRRAWRCRSLIIHARRACGLKPERESKGLSIFLFHSAKRVVEKIEADGSHMSYMLIRVIDSFTMDCLIGCARHSLLQVYETLRSEHSLSILGLNLDVPPEKIFELEIITKTALELWVYVDRGTHRDRSLVCFHGNVHENNANPAAGDQGDFRKACRIRAGKTFDCGDGGRINLPVRVEQSVIPHL